MKTGGMEFLVSDARAGRPSDYAGSPGKIAALTAVEPGRPLDDARKNCYADERASKLS
jgi:hypothetical protein